MREVVIDGVRYTPEGQSDRPSIGIGITTHNRRETFRQSYDAIVQRSPGAKLVVVDDASDQPVVEATYRFETNVGIARAKNKCLELLADCEHIFLFDDDAYPLVDEWWLPYVESPEPHLMRIFEDLAGPNKIRDITVVYKDNQHIAYSGARGCLLYVHRSVLDKVGGMDPAFGQWGYEHLDYSNRIHAAGLTTWRYADVVGAEKLFYSGDEQCKVTRSVDNGTRQKLVEANKVLHDDQYNTAKYCEYRTERSVFITPLLTRLPDPQRGARMRAHSSMIQDLRRSLGDIELVVLHDELPDEDDDRTTFVKVVAGVQPYCQRWVSTWQYLRDHPEVTWVWATDGTDVVMLRDPFPHMQPGKLYIGSEAQIVGCDWMRNNHKTKQMSDFIEVHKDETLLNAGLLGGDRATVMEFLHEVIRLFWDNTREVFLKQETEELVLDMGPCNYAAYTKFADRLVYGPRINTVFKANEKNNKVAWLKHK